jgi:hypothetical protein
MIRYLAVGLIVLASLLLLIYSLVERKKKSLSLRSSSNLDALEMAHNLNLEKGYKLVFANGSNLLLDQVNINSLISLPMMQKLTSQAVVSDQPPIVVSGNGSMAILSKMILAGVYDNALVPNLFYKDYSHTTGGSRFAYLAGCLPELFWDRIGMLVIAGHVDPEMVLLTDLSARKDIFTFAGSDSPAAQAAFLATTEHVLLGEEYFSLGLANTRTHTARATFKVQDFLRVTIILVIIVASLLKALGIY